MLACTKLHRTHIESSAPRPPTARARHQPVCTMIMSLCAVRLCAAEAAMLAGASFDKLMASS